MTRSRSEIDDLLAADKSLFGSVEWIEEGAYAKIVSPVVGANGVVIGGLILHLNAQVETTVQLGNASLVLEGRPIQRLSFRPGHKHVNKGRYPVPVELRLKTLPAGRSRIYRWSDNREWPMSENMLAGRLIDAEPGTLMEAYKLFLEACGISAYLPDPPHRPKLEFGR